MPTIGFAILRVVFLPNSKTISYPLLKIAFIVAAISPNILPVALRQAIDILSFVAISI